MIGLKVRVVPAAFNPPGSDDHRRTETGTVVSIEWNPDFGYNDWVVRFASGYAEPFGPHELEVVP